MTSPRNPPGRDDEHFEHIPWEHLSASGPNRRWLVYVGAAALVAGALTASLARNTTQGGQETITEIVSAPVLSDVTLAATTSSAVTATTSNLYSEADLMAVAPTSLMAEAAAIAEWIATDFFTADGSGAIPSELSSALPVGSSLPTAAEGHRSFVEWSRAFSVDELEPGRYRVLVLVRALGAGAGQDYRRLAPKAVTLDVQWQPEGWSLMDIPASADLPSMVQMPAWPTDELPLTVIEAASTDGGIVVGGSHVGANWRVVVEILDEAGTRWPQVLWFDQDGKRVAPPAG